MYIIFLSIILMTLDMNLGCSASGPAAVEDGAKQDRENIAVRNELRNNYAVKNGLDANDKDSKVDKLDCELGFANSYNITPTYLDGQPDRGRKYSVDGEGDIGLSYTDIEVSYQIELEVTSGSTRSVLNRAKRRAREESRITTFAPKRSKNCLYIEARTLTDRNEKSQAAFFTFDQDVPMLLDPKATIGHLQQAGIDKGVIFKDIEVVGKGDDRSIYASDGLMLKGDVTIILLGQGPRSVEDSKGLKTTFSADYSYKVRFDFQNSQTKADTKVNFLNQEIDYYIKQEKIIGIVIHPKSNDLDIIVSCHKAGQHC